MRRPGRILIGALLAAIFAANAYSIDFPYVYFFSFWGGFDFSLESEAGNRIDVESSIEMTDDYDESGTLYIEFETDWTENEEVVEWMIEVMVDSDGNVYLSGLKDDLYSRMIFDLPLLFPQYEEYGTAYDLGYGISLTFVEELSTYTSGGKTFYDVIETELNFGSKTWTVYFGYQKGIIEIVTDSEVFEYSA